MCFSHDSNDMVSSSWAVEEEGKEREKQRLLCDSRVNNVLQKSILKSFALVWLVPAPGAVYQLLHKHTVMRCECVAEMRPNEPSRYELNWTVTQWPHCVSTNVWHMFHKIKNKYVRKIYHLKTSDPVWLLLVSPHVIVSDLLPHHVDSTRHVVTKSPFSHKIPSYPVSSSLVFPSWLVSSNRILFGLIWFNLNLGFRFLYHLFAVTLMSSQLF